MRIVSRSEAREIIKHDIPCTDYLEKARRGGYICIFCGSGEGPHGTGAVKYYQDTNTCACFACPGFDQLGRKFDVLDLIQHYEHCSFSDAMQLGAEKLGLTIQAYKANDRAQGPQRAVSTKDKEIHTEQPKTPQGATGQAGTADYTDYYMECMQRLDDPAAVSYLQGRGISLETAQAYNLGFDPQADPASAPGAGEGAYKLHPCPRVIIPVKKNHYVARSIDPNTPKGYRVLNPDRKRGAGDPGIFNGKVIFSDGIVFVVEGVFDALSIIECGAVAIATNSANNTKAIKEKLTGGKTSATFILCPDNDPDPKTREKVQERFKDLADSLQGLGIKCMVKNISGSYKDVNDALQGDRPALEAAIKEAVEEAVGLPEPELPADPGPKPHNVLDYINNFMGAEMADYAAPISTGFAELDRESGGLYPGLYSVGGISSVGKTTFCLQLADQIAAQGVDVLFFSLEQSRLELVSKSIARVTAQKEIKNAVNSLQIRRGFLPPHVRDAVEEYKNSVGDRVSIIEGNFNINISSIGDYIRQYMSANSCRPVVFVDYLQILKPADDENNKYRRPQLRETVNEAVETLKQISRELKLTIFIVSSVNRGNYLTPIDFESFKESGGIEYTSDVVWGLQLRCLNEPLFNETGKIKEKRERVKQAKAATPRQVELVCLKNRYGKSNYSCAFDYYPGADLYKEEEYTRPFLYYKDDETEDTNKQPERPKKVVR